MHIILYYPRNADRRLSRLPLSLLALGAVLDNAYQYRIVDGNIEPDPLSILRSILKDGAKETLLAVSVMPGTQMVNAIRHCRQLKCEFPDVVIVWGGYFPSIHTEPVLNSSYVDLVIRGQGERPFIALLERVATKSSLTDVPNLSYSEGSEFVHNRELPLFNPNDRPLMPYHRLDMDRYAIRTFIGNRTFSHESSVGCPHKCNFCGVVDVFHSRWRAEEPERTHEVVRLLKHRYGMQGIEFHDSDFFVSQRRAHALSELLADEKIAWWAEGRIDTLLQYDLTTWEAMRRSGLKMIFFGAESGLNESLKMMDKGGVTVEKTKEIAALCATYNVQPEFSFVMGSHPTKTREEIDATIRLIYELIDINPQSVIHPFIYTPVPFGTIYEKAVEGGLAYPKNLDAWERREWQQYTLRRRPHTPWLTNSHYRRIVNFRAVLQTYRPKLNDLPLSRWRVMILRLFSSWRYHLRYFWGAYDLRLLLRLFGQPIRPEGGF
jgi:radical SAM superfamily enzyme YgiQ (UPF0313 family)